MASGGQEFFGALPGGGYIIMEHDDPTGGSRPCLLAPAQRRGGDARMVSDEQLVAEYRTSRSQQAFAEIVSRHAGMVLRTCLRLVGNIHEAEDVVQAVFLVLAQRPEAVGRCLAGWLHEVARRTACKVIRARARRSRHEEAAGRIRATQPASVAVAMESAELRQELDAALDRLPSRLRQAVILRYLEGREQEEAAQFAGCPRTTLVARSSEGLKRLRVMLQRRGELVSVPVLAGVLVAEATASAVPVAMVSALSSSLAGGLGATVTPTALLAKSAVKGMFWAKAKVCVALVATVATVGAVAPLVVPRAAQPIDWRLFTTPRAMLVGHVAEVGTLEFSPDGKTVATGSYDGTAKLWDAATGRERFHLKAAAGRVHRVTFSPDGKILAAACDDRTTRFWDVATGQDLTASRAATGNCFVSYTRDGKLLATGLQSDVRLLDAATGQELATLVGHSAMVNPGSRFSPDDTLLATGSYDCTVRLWDVSLRKERFVLRGHTACVPDVAFSPDGKTLASAGWDHTVKLWDVTAGTERRTLRGHSADVHSVAFSPDGRYVASASSDKTVKLWDPATAQELATLTGHAGKVWRVVFSPDGRTLATTSADHTAKLWGPGGDKSAAVAAK